MSENAVPRLLIRQCGPGTGPVPDYWVLESAEAIQIGRSSTCEIVLKEKCVSRVHASVFFEDDEWQFSSFGTNGSFLNGERVSHLVLKSGMVIQFATDGPQLELVIAARDDDPAGTGSITDFLGGMLEGDEESTRKLWARCFAMIARVAQSQMSGVKKRIADEEDIAACVFESLYFGAVKGKFPDLSNRENLWRLVAVMTRRKVADLVEREMAQKRGGGRVRGDSIGGRRLDASTLDNVFDQFVGEEPTPDLLAMLEEETEALLEHLPDDEHRQIALSRLEGYTAAETAERLGLSPRTVERRLKKIRGIWARAADVEDEEETVHDHDDD